MLKLTTLIVALGIAGLFSSDVNDASQTDYADCVQKYRSGWGENCSQCANSVDSYAVYLKNACAEAIDVMVCVQETDKTWKKYQHSKMAPNDSLRAYACIGTGKYLSWARKAGDESTVFPTVEEVNKKYKD